MALARLEAPVSKVDPLPRSIRDFIDEANRRVDQFMEVHKDDPIAGFVPSDYESVYRALHWLRKVDVAMLAGDSFCEWGSGLGIVACLAAMIGYEAVGIEIDRRLVDASRQLALSHRVAIQIVQGSYVPDNYQPEIETDEPSDIMTLEHGRAAYEELGLGPDDFDCIFAYPWPGEDGVIASIFDQYAARGALLMSFHGQDGLMLRRKVR